LMRRIDARFPATGKYTPPYKWAIIALQEFQPRVLLACPALVK
jgi:hypothetical protein